MFSIRKNLIFNRSFFISLFCGLLLLSATAGAQDGLMIYPKRIVFDNSKKTQELSLSNNGSDTARYVISIVQIRMNENGSFETIEQPDSGQHFADQNFRFFPRNVVLGPRETQTIKIQPVKTNELQTGEYRSHLYLRAEAEKKLRGDEQGSKKDASISVSVVPVFGISIPVIMTIGSPTAAVSIVEKSFSMLNNTNATVDIKFKRTGDSSVYGDITIEHISASGKITKAGSLQGISIYTPTLFRRFQIPLDMTKGIIYDKGKLHITYTGQTSRPALLAETDIIL